jgi:hypothetical protein
MWERVAWALILFTLGAFMLGTWFNRRRGKALGFWIEDGLKSLGGQPAWTFIKSVSSGAVATVRNTNAPFRSLEAAYYLLTREIPPLYGVELLRGKRDLFSIKANLRNPPASEFDVVPMGGALARELDRGAGETPYTWVGCLRDWGWRRANQTQSASLRACAPSPNATVRRCSGCRCAGATPT